MSREKQRGTAFETAVVRYLRHTFKDDRIDRMPLHGKRDVGDVSGIYRAGKRVVIECKSYSGRDRMAQWLTEAELERGNADALAGVVVSKRRGVGISTRYGMGQQLVTMTLQDFASLIAGERVEQ